MAQRESLQSKLMIPVDPCLAEIRIGKQLWPPRCLIERVHPKPRVTILRAIKIPNWTRVKCSVTRFVEVGAVVSKINLHREHRLKMHVDPRTNVYVSWIPIGRICPRNRVESASKRSKIVADVGNLRRATSAADLAIMWLHPLERSATSAQWNFA